MKTYVLVTFALCATALMSSAPAEAASKKTPQEICDSLQEKIDDDCAHLMCDDLIDEGVFADLGECTSGDDYAEAAQATCEELPTLEDLVKEYNRKHRRSPISCE